MYPTGGKEDLPEGGDPGAEIGVDAGDVKLEERAFRQGKCCGKAQSRSSTQLLRESMMLCAAGEGRSQQVRRREGEAGGWEPDSKGLLAEPCASCGRRVRIVSGLVPPRCLHIECAMLLSRRVRKTWVQILTPFGLSLTLLIGKKKVVVTPPNCRADKRMHSCAGFTAAVGNHWFPFFS